LWGLFELVIIIEFALEHFEPALTNTLTTTPIPVCRSNMSQICRT
jgi:hypothetical protein